MIKKRITQGFAILLCFLMLAGMFSPFVSQAKKNDSTTMRVAYYPLDGFFEYDNEGNEVGYGVDLLDMISRYTGIHFTYVKADSWESTKQMLLNNQADIRMPANKPKTPTSELAYTEQSVIDTYYCVMALKSREDLCYEDYEAFSALHFGITKGVYQSVEIQQAMEAANIKEDNLTFFDEYNDCRKALDQGLVDGIISNIMDLDKDMVQLARFQTMSNFISMRSNSTELNQINDAISQIKLSEASALSDLYKKCFPERAKVPFTKEEKQLIENLHQITFSFRDGQGYLARQNEDGSFSGFYPSMVQMLCDKIGVKCVQKKRDEEHNPKGLEIYPDFYYDYIWAEECEATVSNPYVKMSYYKITRKETNKSKKERKVAAVRNFRVSRDYIGNSSYSANVIWCNTFEECIDAVRTGKADIT